MGLSHLLVPFFVTSVLVSTHKKWYNPYPHYHKYLLKPFLNDISPNCHRSQYSYLLFSTVQLQANKFRKAHIPCQLYKNNAFHHRHHQYTNHLQLLLLFQMFCYFISIITNMILIIRLRSFIYSTAYLLPV